MKRLTLIKMTDLAELSLFEKIWLIAPFAIWFSFQPLFRFGVNSTMYFELSLTLLYVAVLGVASIPIIVHQRQELFQNRAVRIVMGLVLFTAISLVWTPNLTRGILTVGVLGLLFLIFAATIVRKSEFTKIIPILAKLIFTSAVIMSVLAVIQVVAGIWFSQNLSLLCDGCIASQFGFARPNVFTIEPQFFGSLLVAPALIGTWYCMKTKPQHVHMAGLFLIFVALFLTMSRGAIFSFGFGFLLLVFYGITSGQKKVWLNFLIPVFAFFVALSLQGIAATVNPNVNQSFYGASSSTISQLSLGTVNLVKNEANSREMNDQTPVYEGYVEESTDVRLNRTDIALDTWRSNLQTMIFGVGVGGAGVAMHEKFPAQIGAREIVQNEYVERLLETGIAGALLFIGLIASLMYYLFIDKEMRWLSVIVSVFALQWLFFSGYPNVLHIYLVLIVLATIVIERRGQSKLAKQS